MIELALPSGDLQTALIAFKNGADGVYFGMRSFSARKGATNFSFEDLAIIRKYALENNKKIYITVNTLIADNNLDKVYALLAKIDFYGCDGIICQDLGVASLIKNCFPRLPLHGSTQLAVHTIEGVKVLQSYGFERVVLSRELSLEEIRKIRIACPDVELKVFIHGALCFGFSGLCMASYQSCNRSANGGACAQICRNYFTLDGTTDSKYYFSMTDLNAGQLIKQLDEMGIDSAKIEGRMKSKEYVASLTRYYRNILDDRDTIEDEEEVKTNFSRTFSTGYFEYKKDRPSLIDSEYSSHRGLLIGDVLYQNDDSIGIRSEYNLHPYDGICIFVPTASGRFVPFAFSLLQFHKDGGYYSISIPETRYNLTGLRVYKTSDSASHEKEIHDRLGKYQRPVDITFTIEKDRLIAQWEDVKIEKEFKTEEAKQKQALHDNLQKIFSEGGEGRFTLNTLKFNNNSEVSNPFLPLSVIKEMRRCFYEEINRLPLMVKPLPKIKSKETPLLPNRSLLSTTYPWNLEGVEVEGFTYYTLPPVTFNEEKLFKTVEDKLKTTINNRIGLNNIGQLNFALKHPEYEYFIDIYLFLSNRYAASFFTTILPNLVGGYLYPEFVNYEEPWPFTPTLCNDYKLPIFISRACFRHDSLSLSCKGCPQKSEFTITNQDNSYQVLVKDCLTVVYKN